MKKISIEINGKKNEFNVEPGKTLLELLREYGITSPKQSCGVGECGACTVLLDGVAVDSCLTLALWADGKSVRTVEGEARDGQLSKVQQAYVESGAVQCGFCTPGLVMTTTAFVEKNQHRASEVTREEIAKAHAGHLCRCTGYELIISAVEKSLDLPLKNHCNCKK